LVTVEPRCRLCHPTERHPAAHHAVREFHDPPDVTDSATAVETTGEIIFSPSALGVVVMAPDRAAAPVSELFGLRRVPGQPRVVEFSGGVRYRIGAAHRRWRDAVYLHRLPE